MCLLSRSHMKQLLSETKFAESRIDIQKQIALDIENTTNLETFKNMCLDGSLNVVPEIMFILGCIYGIESAKLMVDIDQFN